MISGYAPPAQDFRSQRESAKNSVVIPYGCGRVLMAKGQERTKANNKPKLTIKEKKQKKKDKAASK